MFAEASNYLLSTYSFPSSLSDLEKGHTKRFVIEPLFFEIRLKGNVTDWDKRGDDCSSDEQGKDMSFKVLDTHVLRLKQSVNISLDYTLKCTIMDKNEDKWRKTVNFTNFRFDAFERYTDSWKTDLRNKLLIDSHDDPYEFYPVEETNGDFTGFGWWDIVKKLLKDFGEDNVQIKMSILVKRLYLIENEEDQKIIDDEVLIEKEINKLLRPYMYTASELMLSLETNNEKLQHENEELKKQLEEFKKLQLESKNVEQKEDKTEFDVKKWMKDTVKLGQYGDLLFDAGFEELESILDVTADDLKEIGIEKLGHRKKIIKAVEVLKK